MGIIKKVGKMDINKFDISKDYLYQLGFHIIFYPATGTLSYDKKELRLSYDSVNLLKDYTRKKSQPLSTLLLNIELFIELCQHPFNHSFRDAMIKYIKDVLRLYLSHYETMKRAMERVNELICELRRIKDDEKTEHWIKPNFNRVLGTLSGFCLDIDEKIMDNAYEHLQIISELDPQENVNWSLLLQSVTNIQHGLSRELRQSPLWGKDKMKEVNKAIDGAERFLASEFVKTELHDLICDSMGMQFEKGLMNVISSFLV